MHESNLAFVSRIEFIRSKLSIFFCSCTRGRWTVVSAVVSPPVCSRRCVTVPVDGQPGLPAGSVGVGATNSPTEPRRATADRNRADRPAIHSRPPSGSQPTAQQLTADRPAAHSRPPSDSQPTAQRLTADLPVAHSRPPSGSQPTAQQLTADRPATHSRRPLIPIAARCGMALPYFSVQTMFRLVISVSRLTRALLPLCSRDLAGTDEESLRSWPGPTAITAAAGLIWTSATAGLIARHLEMTRHC